MKRICVFAGSNAGSHPQFGHTAELLGKELVNRDLELVYGESKIGLMGRVANAVLECGGRAIGVMPRGLFRGEMVHTGLTEFYEVNDMHQRKAKMGELADAFIALPGGYGTFEELFEVVSWGQLGIHRKPVGILNIEDYYDPLLNMVQHAVTYGFMPPAHAEYLISDSNPATLLEKLASYEPHISAVKWTDPN